MQNNIALKTIQHVIIANTKFRRIKGAKGLKRCIQLSEQTFFTYSLQATDVHDYEVHAEDN